MKKSFIAVFSIALMSSSGAFAAHFTADPAHSNIDFTIRHMVSKVRGSFDKFEGAFDFDETKGEGLENVKFSVDTASINTGNKKRDDHLRSGDFFDASKNPKITFVGKSVTKNGDKKFKLVGDLTMHGVTKSITWDVEYLGSQKNMMGGISAGFTATTRVNRKEFGVSWNKIMDAGGAMLGEDVDMVVNLETSKEEAKSPASKDLPRKK